MKGESTTDQLGEWLVARGQLSPADLSRAREVAARTRSRLAVTLSRLGMADDRDLAEALAEIAGCLQLHQLPEDSTEILSAFNPRFLRRNAALPLRIDEAGCHVALADPTDDETIAALAFASGRPVVPTVATYAAIEEALTRHSAADDRDDLDAHGELDGAADDVERLLDSASDAPIIRLVNRLLTAASNRRASDIHIEPMNRFILVRFRIDGRLVEAERLPDRLMSAITTRIKVMAELDIAESRLPQDGRLRFAVNGRDLDVRVATTPTRFGESIVLRLLGRSSVPLDLEALGLAPEGLAALERAIERPHGIILITGPTGSGKTTTLYAALNRLQRPEVKILTVEDPVEILIEGVNQVQVRPEIDLTYAAALRAFLRQDPDILMIGEIRDRETAEIAIRAAMTGHLVLSTLHTNDALGAITRLIDLGVPSYLIAETLICTAAQRLVRSLCAQCRVARPLTEGERRLFAAHGSPVPETLFEPGACDRCGGSGFAGRRPLLEVIEVDEALRSGIREGRVAQNASSDAVAFSLLSHGLRLAGAGATTLAEVRRAIDFQ